jgi:hypothetical protein
MLIKLVRGDGSKSETYECMHYTVNKVTPGSYAATHGLAEPGVSIEVGRKAPREPSGPTLVLQKGDVAYVMNNKGDTVDSIRIDMKEEDNEPTVQTEEG